VLLGIWNHARAELVDTVLTYMLTKKSMFRHMATRINHRTFVVRPRPPCAKEEGKIGYHGYKRKIAKMISSAHSKVKKGNNTQRIIMRGAVKGATIIHK